MHQDVPLAPDRETLEVGLEGLHHDRFDLVPVQLAIAGLVPEVPSPVPVAEQRQAVFGVRRHDEVGGLLRGHESGGPAHRRAHGLRRFRGVQQVRERLLAVGDEEVVQPLFGPFAAGRQSDQPHVRAGGLEGRSESGGALGHGAVGGVVAVGDEMDRAARKVDPAEIFDQLFAAGFLPRLSAGVPDRGITGLGGRQSLLLAFREQQGGPRAIDGRKTGASEVRTIPAAARGFVLDGPVLLAAAGSIGFEPVEVRRRAVRIQVRQDQRRRQSRVRLLQPQEAGDHVRIDGGVDAVLVEHRRSEAALFEVGSVLRQQRIVAVRGLPRGVSFRYAHRTWRSPPPVRSQVSDTGTGGGGLFRFGVRKTASDAVGIEHRSDPDPPAFTRQSPGPSGDGEDTARRRCSRVSALRV